MITQKRITGDFGERAAEKLLRKKHYRIIARNWRDGHHEIDLIVKNREYIVFVEVKTRSVESPDNDMLYGPPSSAVNRSKKLNTISASLAFLRENKTRLQPRIDVIEVYLDKNAQKHKVLKINHFENAITRGNL